MSHYVFSKHFRSRFFHSSNFQLVKHLTVNSFSRVTIKSYVTTKQKKIYNIDTMDFFLINDTMDLKTLKGGKFKKKKTLKRGETTYLKKKWADRQVPNIYKIEKKTSDIQYIVLKFHEHYYMYSTRFSRIRA